MPYPDRITENACATISKLPSNISTMPQTNRQKDKQIYRKREKETDGTYES